MLEEFCANCGLRKATHNQDTLRCASRADGARWVPQTEVHEKLHAAFTEAKAEIVCWTNANTIMCSVCFCLVPDGYVESHKAFHESAKKWFAAQLKEPK